MITYVGNNLWFVGKVERLVGFKIERVCACCNFVLAHCACEHDVEHVDTSCIRRSNRV
jgi:hypothetical protein